VEGEKDGKVDERETEEEEGEGEQLDDTEQEKTGKQGNNRDAISQRATIVRLRLVGPKGVSSS
jgi:hypothetical protein